MAAAFQFDPTGYPDVNEHGDWSEEATKQIANLRVYFPEVAHWGGLALGIAWGGFSQSIYAVGWLCEDQIRWPNQMFLAYLYVEQLRPSFEFGSMGDYFGEIDDLSQQQPWLLEGDHAPSWADEKSSNRDGS